METAIQGKYSVCIFNAIIVLAVTVIHVFIKSAAYFFSSLKSTTTYRPNQYLYAAIVCLQRLKGLFDLNGILLWCYLLLLLSFCSIVPNAAMTCGYFFLLLLFLLSLSVSIHNSYGDCLWQNIQCTVFCSSFSSVLFLFVNYLAFVTLIIATNMRWVHRCVCVSRWVVECFVSPTAELHGRLHRFSKTISEFSRCFFNEHIFHLICGIFVFACVCICTVCKKTRPNDRKHLRQ